MRLYVNESEIPYLKKALKWAFANCPLDSVEEGAYDVLYNRVCECEKLQKRTGRVNNADE